MIISSKAVWLGSENNCTGRVTIHNKFLNNVFFFGDSEKCPEHKIYPNELLSSAHAVSFTAMLGDLLSGEGYHIGRIETISDITVDKHITNANLFIKAKIPAISNKRLNELSELAKNTCPISRVLNIPITVEVFIIGENML